LAKITTYEYEVSGHGEFPLDMLRYDTAWPAYEAEIHLFDPPRPSGTNRAEYLKPRTIRLRSNRQPTAARWASFGWNVGEIRAVAVTR